MPSVDERLARLEEQMVGVREDLKELTRAINGPNGSSIRHRLHKLENDGAAARVAAETLQEVRRQRGEGFSKRQQIAVLLFGAVASMGTIVSVVVAVAQLSEGG